MCAMKVVFDPLTKDNYDTWKLHVEALLVKSDNWGYVDGSCAKPAPTDTNSAEVARWEKADRKARSDLILAIGQGVGQSRGHIRDSDINHGLLASTADF